jgi:hypothetical protein
MAFAIKICAAAFTLLGVVIGVVGTYLMTSAYHPFNAPAVTFNFFRVLALFITFQWKKAWDMLGDAAFFGEVNREDRTKSLFGIYVLGVGFLFQTIGAILFVVDVFNGRE